MTIVGTPTSVDETTARAKLARMTDSDTEPTLAEADIDDMIDAAARPDASGYTRASASWSPTWDFDAGAALGWERKASRAAAWYSFAEDGQRFDRAQVYAHCTSQAERHRRRAATTITAETII